MSKSKKPRKRSKQPKRKKHIRELQKRVPKEQTSTLEVRSFTVNSDGIMNVLPTPVGIAPMFSPDASKKPEVKQFNAIWDTGATGTAITEDVVKKCKLKPIGKVQVNTANGVRESNVYKINVALPNRVMILGVRATDTSVHGADVLIGMDIIGTGDFAVTNFKGKTTMSFRIPSVGKIDFGKDSASKSR